MQNNGKERQKACWTCNFVFLLIRKKRVLHVQFVFLLIGSIDLDAILILIFFCLQVLLTRASLLALAKFIY